MHKKVILAVALFAVTPAYAAGGMPQMDPTWFTNGFVWLFVSFLVLYLAVARFIVPSIASVLTARDEAIEGAIREAEKTRHEAESARGSGANESNSARASAAEIIAKAQMEASSDASEAVAKIDRDLSQRISHASAVLEDAVAKAKSGIDAAAQEVANAMIQKLSGAAEHSSEAPKLKLAKS